MKTLIAIMTTESRTNYRHAIEQTWLKNLDKNKFDIKFIYAYKGNSYITDHEIYLGNLIDCYEQLPLKTYHLLKFVNRHLSGMYDSIIKCNDDIFIDCESFNKIQFHKYDYVGALNQTASFNQIGRIRKSKMWHWFKCDDILFHVKKKVYFNLKYAEGSGYFLSEHSILRLLQTNLDEWRNTPETYKGEDVFVGALLSDAKNVATLDLKELPTLPIDLDMWEGGALIHPVHFSLMEQLYTAKNLEERLKILFSNIELNDYFIQKKKYGW
jgi:hypothetical protein